MKTRVEKMCALLCILLMVGGCAATPTADKTAEGYVRFCRGLVGQDIAVVFEEWGYADRTFVLPGGTKAYGYMRSEDPRAYWSSMYHEIQPPDLMTYPPRLDDAVRDGAVLWSYRSSRWCSTYFETDSNNRIIKVTWHGHCRMRETRPSQ